MKCKTTKKEVKESFHKIICIGYCDAQSLLSEENPFAYSARVEGWACDYYDVDGVCISTGYAPLDDKNVKHDYKLVREYEEKASKAERKDRPALLRELVKKLTE